MKRLFEEKLNPLGSLCRDLYRLQLGCIYRVCGGNNLEQIGQGNLGNVCKFEDESEFFGNYARLAFFPGQ